MAEDQWQSNLSRLRKLLDSSDPQRPNAGLVEQLTKQVNELTEIVSDAEASQAESFSSSILALTQQHAAVLSDQAALKALVERVAEGNVKIEVPEDPAGVLKELERSLGALEKAVDHFQKKTATPPPLASAEQRNEWLNEMTDLQETEAKSRSKIEQILQRALGGLDSGSGAENAQPPSGGELSSTSMQQARSKDLHHKNTPPPPDQADDALGAHETTTSRAKSGEGVKAQADERDKEDKGPRAAPSKVRRPKTRRATRATKRVQKASDESAADLEGAPRSSGSSKPTPTEPIPHSIAQNALNGMLVSGRFARAYWLTRADSSLGDPDLFGALAEGSRIGPGDPCPGALVHFLNGLVGKADWQEDDRLLLGAAVLGPCLFVNPLPQDIYQLVDGFPKDALMQRVKELCVFQGAKIRPENLGTEAVGVGRAARMEELQRKAHDSLQRIPHVGFMYPPAAAAFRHLYRAGSELHQLLTIVAKNQASRLNEARAYLRDFAPHEVVSELHNDPEITALKQPLDGRARDKLTRHLLESIALADEWVRLGTEVRDGDQSGDQAQSAELLDEVQKLLPNARRAALDATKSGRAAMAPFSSALENLAARIQGSEVDTPKSISNDLLLLSGVALEDDLEPAEESLCELRGAILAAEKSDPEPMLVVRECLSRREFIRARRIIDTFQLVDQADGEYRREIEGVGSDLLKTARDLKVQTEDAFLLGQLREDSDEDSATSDSSYVDAERSHFLGVIGEAEGLLDGSNAAAVGNELRSIWRRVHEIKDRLTEMTSTRRERLQDEFQEIIDQLPKTTQGEDDRDYLTNALDKCIKENDHVAAFNLLDRGRRAAQSGDAVVRASTGSSESLKLFLKRSAAYFDALSKAKDLSQLAAAVQKGSTFAKIPFGKLNDSQREEVARAIQAWQALLQLESSRAGSGSTAKSTLQTSLEELLRFIGLPLRERRPVQVADTTQRGFAHLRVMLSSSDVSSPIPAFGSACDCRYDLIVSNTRSDPAQVEAYIRRRRLTTSPVLVVLIHPQEMADRVSWQSHFAGAQLTAAPLDLTFFVHLCGELNRPQVLFDLALPFTWARPYITEGEVATEMFVGRQKETEALASQQGSCIVFGGRQLGKSALLRHVVRVHHAPKESTFVIYLDVNDLGADSEGSEGRPAMVRKFWRRVYDQLVRCEAVAELSQSVLKSKGSRLEEEMLDHISTHLSRNSAMRIVLLLDETDKMLDCDAQEDFNLIRRLRALMMDTNRRFKAVFAGLQSVQRYYHWKNHPFAQLGEEMVVGPLPPDAAQELIIKPLRALGFAFEDPHLVLRTLTQTNYHPGLIQIIGYRLLDSLFKKSQLADAPRPIRTISLDDLLAVETDSKIMEDIFNRFDWTLNLDDRYKVLTYALVREPDPTARRGVAEFAKIGSGWWKEEFEDMDRLALRAVLEEMVGLGVLLSESSRNVRTYRLRSPNLLRLLGSTESIESELLRITTRERSGPPDPRKFHSRVDDKPTAFGSLNNEQVGHICGQQQPFQLTLITGSDSLGLNTLDRQVDKMMQDLSEEYQGRAWKKVQVSSQMGSDALVRKLRDAFKRRKRPHQYAAIRLADVQYQGECSTLLNCLLKELGHACTNDSMGHIAVLLDPSDSWRWILDQGREHLLAQSRVTEIELSRWTEEAITNALDKIGARTNSRAAGEEMFKLTSGFHLLVSHCLSEHRLHATVNASKLVSEWKTHCDGLLATDRIDSELHELGLRGVDPKLEAYVCETLSLSDERADGRLVLTDTSFELAAEAVGDEVQEWVASHDRAIREWIRTMDLARPLDTSDEGKREMALAPWVRSVLSAGG